MRLETTVDQGLVQTCHHTANAVQPISHKFSRAHSAPGVNLHGVLLHTQPANAPICEIIAGPAPPRLSFIGRRYMSNGVAMLSRFARTGARHLKGFGLHATISARRRFISVVCSTSFINVDLRRCVDGSSRSAVCSNTPALQPNIELRSNSAQSLDFFVHCPCLNAHASYS